MMIGKIYVAMTEERASGLTLYQFGAFATDSSEKTLRITVTRHLNEPWDDSRVWTVVKMWDSYNTAEDYSYMREMFNHIGDTLGMTEIDKRKCIYTLEDQQIFISFINEMFSPL